MPERREAARQGWKVAVMGVLLLVGVLLTI